MALRGGGRQAGGVGRPCVGAERGGVGGREPKSRGRPLRDSGSQTTGEVPLTVPASLLIRQWLACTVTFRTNSKVHLASVMSKKR